MYLHLFFDTKNVLSKLSDLYCAAALLGLFFWLEQRIAFYICVLLLGH